MRRASRREIECASMALDHERLLCPPQPPPQSTVRMTDESRPASLIRSHKRGRSSHERAQSKNQRARTRVSFLIVSVILVPIVTQIQPIISQAQPFNHKSQQQQPPPTLLSATATKTSQSVEDWARRLRPLSTTTTTTTSASSNRRQDDASAPQQMFIEPDLASRPNQTPLWLRALNGDQRSSSLGRALEATRVFMRQQHQAPGGGRTPPLTSTSQTRPARFPLIQSLVAATGQSNGELKNNSPNITTTAGRLVQFLLQPKSLGANLPTTSNQQVMVAARNDTRASDQEPIQTAASSESFYEVNKQSEPGTGWPHRLLKDGRNLVTLSAPYEHGPRTLNSSLYIANRTSRASGAQTQVAAATSGRSPVNLVASASGNHHSTASLSYADGSPVEDPTAGGGDNAGADSSPSDAGEQSGQEPNQAQDVYYLEQQVPQSQPNEQQQQQRVVLVPMSQEEAEQRQQQQSQADNDPSAQWNATGQMFQMIPSQPPDGVQDPAEQQDQETSQQQPQQQVDESSQLPGEEEVQLQMNAQGELFEGPGSEVSFGQRPPATTANNETTAAYLQLAYDPSLESDRKSNKQFVGVGDNERNRLSNLTTGYLLPESATNDSGREVFSNSSDEVSQAAAQLPSQYESVIRVPPEGHYDDYFKPAGGGGDEHGRFVSASSSATADFRAQQQQNETGEQQQVGANQTRQDAADSQYQYFMNQQQLFADQQHRHTPLATSNHRGQQQQRPVSEDSNSSRSIQHETQHGDQQQQLYQLIYQQPAQQVASDGQHTSNSSSSSGAHSPSGNSSSSSASSGEQDNIQLIVANSASNLQDPDAPEKVITYTSEDAGRNFARLVGKPARHTFYNKDLNESPPPSSTATPTSSPVKFRSTRSPEYPTPTQTSRPVALTTMLNVSTQRSDELADAELAGLEGEGPAIDEVGGASLIPAGQFGLYATSGHLSQVQRQSRGPGGGGRGQPVADNHRRHPESHAARNHAHHHRGRAQPQSSGSSNRLVRQQPILGSRPQVTEAKFDLKELPLNAPTAMPSVGASTVKSIAELPTKVKRLRDHQVDKNELMNELLTALDRVKSAIYKLQPLTAKMNAMYRKSVTSNTRDQILDNNKGTYSKRYPPGDFDDTYDRMHPSELLEHQQRLSSRGAEGRSARLNRATSGARNSTRAPRRQRNRGTAAASRTSALRLGEDADDQEPSDSKSVAVYLPAPVDFRRVENITAPIGGGIIATGTGRRVGGKLRGRLSLRSSSGGEIIYDDDIQDHHGHLLSSPSDVRTLSKRSGDIGEREVVITDEGSNSTTGGGFRELQENRKLDDEGGDGNPLFGYRITIYQSPELGDSATPMNDTQTEEANRILSYSLIGGGDDDDDEQVVAGAQDELMATSESSVVTTPEFDDDDQINRDDDRDTSESKASKRKKMMMVAKKKSGKEEEMEEEEEKGKKGKEKEHKKGNKWSKHEKRGKKGDEEHKKKKEFKKIKHHKGLMSKESHKLHRDKHIKAHDRGAAKEKALKERTQIEFFEREQIVDDEFEKGKKSTTKAGWASGHDAKKSSLAVGGADKGHDSMTMGGSNYVNHLESPPSGGSPAAAASAAHPMLVAASEHGDSGGGGGGLSGKGQGHSSESSSGKQSNKFEKKQMEAKGKKFKGWREKGYKIITETEFIDRGSLHDSAYKKRDKGAAHHQKFKKHEAKSEGHQGSMHEHHKKSHKKEEKKSKMEEKKKVMSGKEAEEMGAKKKKKQQQQHEEKKKKKKEKKEDDGDYDQEESAPTMSSLGDTGPRARPPVNRKPFVSPSRSNDTSDARGQATTLNPIISMLAAGPKSTTTTLKPQQASNRTKFHIDGADQASLARHRYVITPSSILDSFASTDAAAASRRSDHLPEPKRETNRTSNSHHQLNNISLSEIINRLNPSQAAKARAEASSPLLRLVSTLAKLDNQQRQLATAGAVKQQTPVGQNQSKASTQMIAANQQSQSRPPLEPHTKRASGSVPQRQTSVDQKQQRPANEFQQPNLSAFAQQQNSRVSAAHQITHQSAHDRFAALHPPMHFAGNLSPSQQNTNALYQNQQRQIHLQPLPPLPPSGAYLPPLTGAAYNNPAALASESSPFSFMADSQVGQTSPFDALVNFDSFDYEQPADSQQQQQQLFGNLPPSQLQAPHHQQLQHQFNFLTDQQR